MLTHPRVRIPYPPPYFMKKIYKYIYRIRNKYTGKYLSWEYVSYGYARLVSIGHSYIEYQSYNQLITDIVYNLNRSKIDGYHNEYKEILLKCEFVRFRCVITEMSSDDIGNTKFLTELIINELSSEIE